MTAETNTTTFTTCNGKIDSNGYCNNCGQISQHTSAFCGRQIPFVEKHDTSKTAEQIAEEIMQAGQFGGSLQVCAELIKSYAEQAIDRCAEKSYMKYITIAGKPELKIIADKNDILKIKSELK